jgi:Ca2+-transporting ATPase
MTVTVIDVAGQRLDIDESWQPGPSAVAAAAPPPVQLLLAGGTLCNDAVLKHTGHPERFHTVGDPTEGALLAAAARAGLPYEDVRAGLPRLAEAPFDSERKRMTTVHPLPAAPLALPPGTPADWQTAFLGWQEPFMAFTKGAVDSLLEACTDVWVEGRAEPVSDHWRQRIQAANDDLAQNGMRVLGLAFRPVASLPAGNSVNSLQSLESNLTFVGLVGIMDPPRPEVREAVQTSLRAGLRPVMITGDHPLTARHVARELGIAAGEARVVTGADLARMSPAEFEAAAAEVSIYARVSPEHKLRIVEALQNQGHIVAMTGDGVNDAPALKRADIGVAMGLAGTDVSKEAADMVLRDDNFATIVAAVEEGRVIYDNVRRFVKFSVAGNIGKVAVMLCAPLLGINVALQPLQLLWLNLLTDGLLGLGLGVEPPERNTMQRPPNSPRAGLFSGGMGWHVAWVGALIGATALGVGYVYFRLGRPEWQTMIFTTLASLQVWQALATRSFRDSVFRTDLGSNRLMLVMVGAVLGLQGAAVYLPFLEDFFMVTPLALGDLALCIGLGSLPFVAIELEKWFGRKKKTETQEPTT